ncbi:hypothetical protein [Streptomyces wuyuanensis]|uniref:hypothetical protein n=1 Tax=Streptomyces wuyuanensis TaxID=1196353 RepID=UPI003443F90B
MKNHRKAKYAIFGATLAVAIGYAAVPALAASSTSPHNATENPPCFLTGDKGATAYDKIGGKPLKERFAPNTYYLDRAHSDSWIRTSQGWAWLNDPNSNYGGTWSTCPEPPKP